MSYTSSFHAALAAHPFGERLSGGTCAVMSLSNLECLEADRIPGDHDAHVLAAQVARTTRVVAHVLTNFCPPPVVNDVVPVVTTPAMSGQGVGSLAQRSARISGSGAGLVAASLETVVAQVATSPDSLIPSRMAALITMYASQHVISSDITPIAAENKNARPTASLNAAFMAFPVVVPSIIRTVPGLKKSNLGLNGRLVKRGATVSFHGIRYLVTKVNRGHFYGKPLTIFGVHYPGAVSERLQCESVQVVA